MGQTGLDPRIARGFYHPLLRGVKVSERGYGFAGKSKGGSRDRPSAFTAMKL